MNVHARSSKYACSFSSTAAPLAARGEGTVLVIDDEEIIRSIAKNALRRLGYRVMTAINGAQGVQVLRTIADEVRVVLLDMTMPGLSGEATVQALRNIRPDIPIVLSSGFSEAEALRRFRGHRLAGFLQKPYTVRTLADRVKSATAPQTNTLGMPLAGVL
jgi:two-component system, cell cycle sensor histidine kinase and response regulator CckA